MLAVEIIKTKRSKKELSSPEIEFFIEQFTKGHIHDYQMSAFLMATFLNGMTPQETVALTQAMIHSGTKIKFPEELFPVDKHSTGGVGDKTSLILAPIVAACGLPVPMMSGRGLGHTGGTLDKLESIPGFNVHLDLNHFQTMIQDHGLSFIGQTDNICPADKKMYALRDVTGTVESLPLICASIMSKKIAEGIRGLVLDVKMGSGAFMKNIDDARSLAQGLVSIGKGSGIKTHALITNMDQPLGLYIGNALEIHECISILTRSDFKGQAQNYKSFADTEYLSIELAAHMLAEGLSISIENARAKARVALDSGSAYAKFEEVCRAQGGELDKTPVPQKIFEIYAAESGYLNRFDGEKIGVAGICLGAGRLRTTDKIDPLAGIQVHKKIGDKVLSGDVVYSLYGTITDFEKAKSILNESFYVSEERPSIPPLIMETLLDN